MVANVSLSYGGSRAMKRKDEATQYGHVGKCAPEQGDEQVIKGKARFYQGTRMMVVRQGDSIWRLL